MPERNRGESWSTERLAEFLALIAGVEDEATATRRGVERVAEALDAKAVALVADGATAASIGFGTQAGPEPADLVAATDGPGRTLVLAGIGACYAISVPVDADNSARLVVARVDEPFDEREIRLLRSMGRVLTLGLRTVRLLENERALRTESQRQADERSHLLGALRERQVLVERLARLQRVIVDRRPLDEVLEGVVEGACELLGDEVGVLRRYDGAGAEIAAAVGVEVSLWEDAVTERREPALGDRARNERRVVVIDTASGDDPAQAREEFRTPGIATGIAAPVYQGGSVVASLAVGSRDERREYGPRDQQTLLAFAEVATLALNHDLAVAEAIHEAMHDGLTRLPNRSLFVDRLEHALARAHRSKTPVGVLFCDLDGFKTVNDSLGHTAGDQLLVGVGHRLVDALQPVDTVARMGGDEFAVLIDELDEPDHAARVAQRILDALEAPFDLSGREVYIGVSIGIATGITGTATMLRDADLAMYRAKSEGKRRYALFEPGLHTAVVERLELEVDLKRAVERGELELLYQPIFSLRTGVVAGLEALVRWHHPTRGLVPPDRFVPLAEESGQIGTLGRWVLRDACRQAALWRARYPGFPGLQVGVNISAAQLSGSGLVDDVASALTAAQLDPEALTLEITETALMGDVANASERLGELKRLGVDIAVDDFGRGYSSLTYLQRFPLDNLKVDRHFVAGTDGEDNRKLLRAIIDLAEIFGLRPIAEGIERPEEARMLLALGCELGQGHLLSEPLSAADADDLLLRVGLLGDPLGPPQGGEPPLGSPADDVESPPDAGRGAGDADVRGGEHPGVG
jgi:diguanylate cyclase (GGDEF)-like protein